MALNQEQQAELLKFINLDEADDLEKAKEKFQSQWVKAEEVNQKIGKITGTIANHVKKAWQPLGIELTDDDFKDKKIEDVIRAGTDRAKSEFEKLKSDWEKRASGTGSDDLIKEWEGKYKTLEKKLGETDKARLDAMTKFEEFQKQVTEEKKSMQINSVFEKALGSVKLDPAVNEVTLRGFKSVISDKYLLDLDENGNPIVMDKKTNQRLSSSKKAGDFMSIEDVLVKEATELNIIQKNPVAGNRFNQKPAFGQQQPQKPELPKGVNPRFFGGH